MVNSGPEPSSASLGRLSQQARRHNQMRRAVVMAHPEVRALAGPNPYTAFAVPVLLAIHWTAAWAVSDTNLAVVFLVSFFIGQVVIHATGTLVHETAHRLIFKGQVPKLIFDLGLEMILASFAKQLTYQHEHVSSHHKHIGDYAQDYEHEDICVFQARTEFGRRHPRLQKLVTTVTLFINLLPLGFLISDELYPRFYGWVTGRPVRDKYRQVHPTRPARWETWSFIAWSVAINIFLFWAFGFYGWLYHTWSLSLFLGKCGVTNLGQSLSEHQGADVLNPTKSTYWWGNWFLFNTGYHNEHHTFSNVPWTRLPKLKQAAPEVFSSTSERTYFGLWWDHVCNDFSPTRRNPLVDEVEEGRR